MNTDFIGFSFDGVHSSELNIYRVSDGDRYSEEILPPLEDYTVDVTGRDETYFYGTHFQSRNISINIAFDSVTEKQYRNIRRLFGQKRICPLIFDERPYKVFMAKISEPITLETICFDEQYYEWVQHATVDESGNITDSNGYVEGSYDHKNYLFNEDGSKKVRRIYKGEGTIEFVCYNPFAHQQFKTLEEYTNAGYVNVDEWKDSSGILTASEYTNIDKYKSQAMVSEGSEYYPPARFGGTYNCQFNVYNPGDISAPFYLFLPYVADSRDNDKLKIFPNSGDYVRVLVDGATEMFIEPFSSDATDTTRENGVVINTRAELIEGVWFDYQTKTWIRTGTLYNYHILSGKFGRIKKGDKFNFRNQGIYLNYKESGSTTDIPYIFYNYLYY